jgi:HlyD family secretion protein
MSIKQFRGINNIEMKNTNIIYLLLLSLGITSCKEKTNKYDASGSFEATETIISAEANGKILQLNIEEGQQLDSGQLVGFIDSTQLELSKLQLVQSKKAILSGRPEANTQVEALKTELSNALRDHDRTEKLVKGGIASQQQLE